MINPVRAFLVEQVGRGRKKLVSQDRRIRRTQQLLARALISLTLEKGYDAVTIRDITAQADVGYATFFRHYRDKYELLQDVVDVVMEELITLMIPEAISDNPEGVGVLLFQYVQKNSEVMRILLSSNEIIDRVISIATEQILLNKNLPPTSPAPVEIAAYHVVSSSISLVKWWLTHQMPYTPEQMGRIYYDLIMRPINPQQGTEKAIESPTL